MRSCEELRAFLIPHSSVFPVASVVKETARIDFRHCFAYHVLVDDQKRDDQKRSGLVVLGASIICCIRLKGMDIKPSPKLTATVSDSVHLAQMIVEAVERRPINPKFS